MAHFSESLLIINLKRILYIFGLWPDPTSHYIYYIYSYFLHFIVSFAYSLFQTINLVMSMNDFVNFTESVYSTLTVLAYLFKLINYIYYRDHIIECLTKLLKMQQNNRSNENIFRAKLGFLNKLTTFFYVSANFTVIAAGLKTLLSTIPELPIASWYPLDWQHNRRDFWIVFLHDLIGAFIVGNINLGMDSYAYYLMAMITVQFETLHVYIKEIGTNFEEDQSSRSYKKALQENLESFNLSLKEHQKILELVSDVERYFSLQFFSQICLSGAVLSCGVYQMITVNPTENFFQFAYLLAFMMTVMLQTFLYTYYAHCVLVASDAISTSVYSSKWYEMLPSLGKNFVILMERLKHTSQILAGKIFPMNLQLFGKADYGPSVSFIYISAKCQILKFVYRN